MRNALRFYQQGRLVICVDEKTGMQILQRKYPTQVAQPGKPAKREQEYIRHGVRVLIASFVVPTGQVLWHLGPTRTSEDFAAHLANVRQQLPAMTRYDWVLDNLNTHWSLDVCRARGRVVRPPLCPQGPAASYVGRPRWRTALAHVTARLGFSDSTAKQACRWACEQTQSRIAILPCRSSATACVIDQGSRPQCCSNVTSARSSAHVQDCCFLSYGLDEA